MADHKNQHYVPRCALKPFTLNAEGNAINLYNLNRRQFIQNAPVKGQCSRNFFYGKDDLGPEKALSELEGQYARIVEVINHRRQVTLPDVEWLRLFAIIQTRRTAQAVFQLSQFTSQMMDAAFKNNLDQRPDELEHEDLVRMGWNGDIGKGRFPAAEQRSVARLCGGLGPASRLQS